MRPTMPVPTVLLALALALAACAPACAPGCATDMNFEAMGRAHACQIESQTLNPQAGGAAPVLGLDGPLAARAVDQYRNGGQQAAGSIASQMEAR